MADKITYRNMYSQVKFFQNLTVPDKITFATLALSALVLALSFIVGGAAALNVSSIVSIFVLIVGDRLTSISARHEDRQLLNNINISLHEVAMCIHMGSPNEGIDYVISKTSSATAVWNTFVPFGLNPREQAYRYGSEDANRVKVAISNFLDKGGNKWTDVISKSNVEFDVIAKELSSTHHKGFYQCGKLKSEFPIVNFIILQYGIHGEHNTEVLFGWGHHNKDRIGHVFLSRDYKMVATFLRYYEVLMEECDWVNGEVTTPILSTLPSPPDLSTSS